MRAMAAGVRIPDGYGPPIVIAGVGGSGTRVAARLLVELGFYIGEDLNEALDNLTYTLLLKRPRWYLRASTRQRRVNAGARPLVTSLTDASGPTPREWLTLLGAMLGTMPRGNDRLGRRRGMHWAPSTVRRLLASGGHDPSRAAGWGWKEPNAIVLLAELITAFPGMRFIHVVRDPEQVAHGKNQTMVYNWSQHVGLQPPRPGEDLVERSLEFCRLVTDQTADIGRARLGKRYHLLDMNRLCGEPEGEVDALLAFLGIEVGAEVRERLCAIPDSGRLAGSSRS
jgi:Sulfotransferase family